MFKILLINANGRSCIFILLTLSMHFSEGHSKACKYWCKNHHQQYYCCPNEKSELWQEDSWHEISWPLLAIPWLWITFNEPYWYPPYLSVTKEKSKMHCPPLRSHCSRTYDWYNAPVLCEDDKNCLHSEKCCYDVCLEHKTCKPAE